MLNDAQKTAVISQIGMGRALGLSSRGNAFPRFLSSKAMSSSLGAEIRGKIEKPIKFQWGAGGAGQPPGSINGYDATILIDVCKAVAQAYSKNALAQNQEGVVKQAAIIMGASPLKMPAPYRPSIRRVFLGTRQLGLFPVPRASARNPRPVRWRYQPCALPIGLGRAGVWDAFRPW